MPSLNLVLNLKEVDPPEQKCESDSAAKGGYGSDDKGKEGLAKIDDSLPDWNY